MTNAWNRYLPFVLICLIGVLLYVHTLHAPFYLDDEYSIAENAQVKDLGQAVKGAAGRRGLSVLTFAVNYQFGELEVVGYHLVNIAIHLGATCLVLLLLRRVWPHRPLLSLFGALIFVAHPLQTQAVTYLVQRMTSLSALFFLLALYLYVLAREQLARSGDFRDRRHLLCYGGALLAGGAAILAKENAVVLPAALLFFARLVTSDTGRQWRPLLVYTSPFMVFPLVAVAAYYVVPIVFGEGINTMGYSGLLRSMEGNAPLNYLATQCSVLWIYIRMFFLPYGQALDHGYPVTRELLNMATVAGCGGLAGMAALAWYLRRSQPAISLAITWFFVTLAVESSVIPLDPLFEHRLYLPMFGFSLLASALLARIRQSEWQLGIGVAVILILSILTWQRNALWNDPIAFYEDNLRVAPANERVWFNLGNLYLEFGLDDEGERLIRESIAMNPSRHFGYMSLKELYLAQGRLDEAIGMLHYGIDHVAYNNPLYIEVAFVYGKKGDFLMAIEMLRRGIAADPQVPATYFNLAQMLMFAGEWEQVEINLLKTLELDPSHTDALSMLKNLYQGQPSGIPPVR